MKYLPGVAFLIIIMVATPGWAGESGGFDPDQPFKQGFSQRLLESVLGQALEALDEHFEISGNLDPDSAAGDDTKKLRFKFYPDGKSKSNDHFAAEGWFGPSQDPGQQEFHFRFALPKSSTPSSADLPANVL
jgi:hypothetical protein